MAVDVRTQIEIARPRAEVAAFASAAKDRAGVGEALHVELERLDAPGEQKVFGVDTSALDRGADAAPAAAGIGGIQQPAVALHELLDPLSGAL